MIVMCIFIIPILIQAYLEKKSEEKKFIEFKNASLSVTISGIDKLKKEFYEFTEKIILTDKKTKKIVEIIDIMANKYKNF